MTRSKTEAVRLFRTLHTFSSPRGILVTQKTLIKSDRLEHKLTDKEENIQVILFHG